MQFIISNLGTICTILSSLIGIAGVIFGVVCKNTKAGKQLKGLAEVVKSFPTFIRTAEKVSDRPEEKLDYVLNQAILSCQARGFSPTEQQITEMIKQIEDQVQLSKDINLKSKQAVKPATTEPTQAPSVTGNPLIYGG